MCGYVGRQARSARVSPGDIVAVLDLHGARPGRRLFQLTPDQVRTPFGVEVVQIAPASVAIEFESTATRRVPLVPEIEGEPAPGFIVGQVTADPAEVEIIGPATAVAAATEALTEPVSVAGAHEAITQEVTVGVLNPALRVKNPRVASVQVQISPGPRERTFREQPLHLRSLTTNLTAQAVPPAVAVLLRGSREGVGKISPSDVLAFVDLAGLGPGDYTLPVQVETPAAAGVVRIDPANVQVSITHAKH